MKTYQDNFSTYVFHSDLRTNFVKEECQGSHKKHVTEEYIQKNSACRVVKLKEGTELCNCLLRTSVAVASKCIHMTLMIWHLVSNSSLNFFVCSIELAAPFYAKVNLTLPVLCRLLFVHLLPTALRLYVETLLKWRGCGFCIIFSALCSFLDVLFNRL